MSFIWNVVLYHTQIVLKFKMSTEKEELQCKYRGLLGPDEAVPIIKVHRETSVTSCKLLSFNYIYIENIFVFVCRR